jgi:hypothetical protein
MDLETAIAPAAPETPAAPAAPAQATPAAVITLEAPAAPPAAPAEPAPVAFAPTGDQYLDQALAYFGKLGLDDTDPAMAAALSGDFLPLKAKLGTLGDKARGYEGFVALAEAAYTKQAQAQEATAQATQAAVLQAVGGAESWEAVRSWATSSLPAAEQASVNAVFKAGGPAAALVAEALAARYRADPGTTVVGKSPVSPNAPRPAPAAATPLTAAEYAAEVRKLAGRNRGTVDGLPEYAQLQARRAAAVAREQR